MKVFVTTQGEYSDYRICEIFTTQELAEQHVQSGQADDWFESEILDSLPEAALALLNLQARGYHSYYVRMDLRGNVISTHENPKPIDTKGEFSAVNREAQVRYHVPAQRVVTGTVIAKSLDGAIKILNEKRIQILAEPWGSWYYDGDKSLPMEAE